MLVIEKDGVVIEVRGLSPQVAASVLTETVTYKPDSKLDFYVDYGLTHPALNIILTRQVPNSIDGGEPEILFFITHRIEAQRLACMTMTQLLQEIWLRVIKESEIHEALEWFKVAGKPWSDPHVDPR